LKISLFEAFEANGVTYEYIEFPHSNHGMYSDLDKQQEYIEKSLDYCGRYLGS
jgi:dipeptidyl aminopeptidase/acylaminoacyl peptidase